MRIAVVDIGGTNIKTGLWEDGILTGEKEFPTEADKGAEHMLINIANNLHSYQSFSYIGISTAGLVDSKEGKIIFAEHIPGYTGMDVKNILEQEFRVPVFVGNDVNCAAVGEAYYGAGKGHDNFLCLTYGTGIGGAIYSEGKVQEGSTYCAGEFGMIISHPEDRNAKEDPFSGCYEKYAATSILVKRVQEAIPTITNGREIFENLKEKKVQEIMEEWLHEVALGLTSLIHIFNPELIILGGGIMEQPYVIQRLQEMTRQEVIPMFPDTKIVAAKLGNKAGVLGAAVLTGGVTL